MILTQWLGYAWIYFPLIVLVVVFSGASFNYWGGSSSFELLINAQPHPEEKRPSFPVLSFKRRKYLPKNLRKLVCILLAQSEPCTYSRTNPYHQKNTTDIRLSSVQFSHSVMSDSLWPHGLQHARLPCPSWTPRACSNSCLLSQWCHPTISPSIVPFSCLQSFPESGYFPLSQFFSSGSQSIVASASEIYYTLMIYSCSWVEDSSLSGYQLFPNSSTDSMESQPKFQQAVL